MTERRAEPDDDELPTIEPSSVAEVDVDADSTRAGIMARAANLDADDAEPYDPDNLTLVPSDEAVTGPIPDLQVIEDLRADRYEILGEIARGGMGSIQEVRDKDLRRNLAMKVILKSKQGSGSSGSAVSPDVLRRFLEEAQITAQLAHPGVVPVHELGVDQDGHTYFTMSRVHGETLANIITKARERSDGWSLNRALQVILRVCETLAFAHRKGVIHRDVKPANVMVGEFGQVYVMDWGLAKVLGRDDAHDIRVSEPPATDTVPPATAGQRVLYPSDRQQPITTMDGVVIGTPAYMPPEQAEGRIAEIDKRSDVYAIGTLLYHLLTGGAPYVQRASRVSARDVLTAVREGPPVPISELDPTAPVEVRAICEKAMARAPDQRYASAEELAEDLRNYLDGYVVRAHKTGLWIEMKKWVRRNTALAATVAAAALVIGSSWIFYTVNVTAARDAAAAAAARETERAQEAELARGKAIAAEKREALRAEEAERERDAKTEALREARVLGLLAASAEEERIDPMTSLLLARAAVRTQETPQTLRRLRGAIAVSRERAVLHGHELAVDAAAFSPSGSRVVTVSPDGTTRLWDAAGKQIREMRSGGAAIRKMDPVRRTNEGPLGWAAFSADGSRIVTAAYDDGARVWDADGTEIAALRGHAGTVLAGEFSPDGSMIVTAARDGTARLWSSDGKELALFRGHGHAVWDARFSPDGSRVVTASQDGKAGLWSVAGHAIASLHGHDGPVRSATFSPDGALIVTASTDGTARVWDADGKPLAELRGHDGAVWSAEFSPDSGLIVTASWDGTARIWSTTGEEMAVLRGHELPLLSARFSPNGQRVVTASFDGTARLWALTGQQTGVLRGHTHLVFTAEFSPDGERVVTASNDKTARLWNVEGGEIAVLRGHDLDVASAAYSPDGAHIVTASWDHTARTWTAEGEPLHVLRGHSDAVWSARYSPDSSRIVTASYDQTAVIWDSDGNRLAEITGHDDTVLSAEFSHDGKRILTSSTDQTARVWNADGTEVVALRGHDDAVWGADFSPDDTRIVTASWDGTARVWDLRGKQLAVLRGHEGRVSSANFSPDGLRIVTASWDRTCRIWDLDGNEIAVLRGHDNVVWQASYSADGTRIVSASSDKTARLWDTLGNELAVLLGHDGPVRSAAISPDGTRIITSSEDRTTRIWLVRADEVLALADQRITREMTPEEHARYAPLLDDE